MLKYFSLPFLISKKIKLVLVGIILLNSLFAQVTSPCYLSVSYIKYADPSHALEYQVTLKDCGKVLSQERINKGMLQTWKVYELLMPTGSSNEYDLIVLECGTDLPSLIDDSSSLLNMLKKRFPVMTDEKIRSIVKQYNSGGKLVKREIFQQLSVLPTPRSPARYVKMNYVKSITGLDSTYVSLEEKEWMDFHQMRMKKGIMAGWELDKKILPELNQQEYDFLSVDYYNNLTGMFNSNFRQEIASIWPGELSAQIMTKTATSRIIVRSEIWKLIDFVN